MRIVHSRRLVAVGGDGRDHGESAPTAYRRVHGFVLCGPGEGEHHDAGPAQIFIKATGEHTGGSFFLAKSTLAPGFAGPPPHRHREVHDMFYVQEGTLTLRLGGRDIEAGPVSFACVPPGVVHTFRSDGDGPIRPLNFNTPAGWENYMRKRGPGGTVRTADSRSHGSRGGTVRLRVMR